MNLENPPRTFRRIFYFWTLVTLNVFIAAQPHLVVEKNVHDFGKVKRGEVLTTEFMIKNTGNLPLVLNEAKVACSCTEVRLPTHPILPGDSAGALVKFNTVSVYGRQDRIVEFRSNASSVVKVRFKARVKS